MNNNMTKRMKIPYRKQYLLSHRHMELYHLLKKMRLVCTVNDASMKNLKIL